MQLTSGLCITSLDQFLDHGGFGRVTLGFDAVNLLRNAAVQNSVHTYSHFYMTPSHRPSECSNSAILICAIA